MRYRMELTEKQLSVLQNALEEWFRLRLGQEHDFADSIAFMDCDLSKENPKHEQIFDSAIQTREAVSEIMRAVFRIAFGPHGRPDKATEDMLIAQDIWDAVRVVRGVSRWGTCLQVSNEPLPVIKKVENDES